MKMYSMCVYIWKISCMTSGDSHELDSIHGGPVSDKLVALTKSSPKQPGCSQNLLGFIQSITNNAGSTVELLAHESTTGELRRPG